MFWRKKSQRIEIVLNVTEKEDGLLMNDILFSGVPINKISNENLLEVMGDMTALSANFNMLVYEYQRRITGGTKDEDLIDIKKLQ